MGYTKTQKKQPEEQAVFGILPSIHVMTGGV
jgi:hypothetical protein